MITIYIEKGGIQMKKLRAIILSLMVLLTVACQSTSQNSTSTTQSSSNQTKKMSVVTTFYPVYYMTKTIAGDAADISMLVSGSVDAHDFEPSAKHMTEIASAKLFVYSSDVMEPWVKKVADGLGSNKKVTFVSSGKDVSFIKSAHNHDHDHEHDGDDHDHDHGSEAHKHSHDHETDPHIWLEPSVAKQQVNAIATALIEADSQNKAVYEKNRDTLLEKLDGLAKEYDQAFANAKQKVFATQHAAFGYIANKYQLEQLSVSDLLDKEPTAQDIARVVSEIKEHKLSTIYVDPSTSKAVVNTVAKEAGVSTDYLYTMESQVENMDYLQLLKANLEALKKSVH